MEDSSIVPDIKVVVWKFGGSDVGDQPGALSQLCDELADFSCALTDSFCRSSVFGIVAGLFLPAIMAKCVIGSRTFLAVLKAVPPQERERWLSLQL